MGEVIKWQIMATWTKIDSGGRIVIPAGMRKAMHLQPGDDVQVALVENELRIIGRDAAIARAQALVRNYIPGDVSLSDQLIVERRAAAKREDEEMSPGS
jgi:AbrB family looped-hinge helix DNA binding protein